MFFGHNSAIFYPISLNFFMLTQETIIYRLVIRNYDFDAGLKKSYLRDRHDGAKESGSSRPA